jgi:hypothetical protein
MGHVFRHPNYYKQLKEKYEQEASSNKHGDTDIIEAGNDPDLTRRVGPEAGTKVQASSSKHQASSSKPQAPSKISGK